MQSIRERGSSVPSRRDLVVRLLLLDSSTGKQAYQTLFRLSRLHVDCAISQKRSPQSSNAAWMNCLIGNHRRRSISILPRIYRSRRQWGSKPGGLWMVEIVHPANHTASREARNTPTTRTRTIVPLIHPGNHETYLKLGFLKSKRLNFHLSDHRDFLHLVRTINPCLLAVSNRQYALAQKGRRAGVTFQDSHGSIRPFNGGLLFGYFRIMP